MQHSSDGRHIISLYRIPAQLGAARGVQIDLDSARIGLRYPVEVGLVGKSAPQGATAVAAILSSDSGTIAPRIIFH